MKKVPKEQAYAIIHNAMLKTYLNLNPRKFVNPFTDFGLKKLFGEKGSEILIKDFLNCILPLDSKITKVKFQTDKGTSKMRCNKPNFSIYCINEDNQACIVEIQKPEKENFKSRSVYHSTFLIQDSNARPVYCINFLDFIFEDNPKNSDYIHIVRLKNERKDTFYDKLTYVFVEIPKFQKEEINLDTQIDKWLYFLKNLESWERAPKVFQNDNVFNKAFDNAKISNYSEKDQQSYKSDLLVCMINKAHQEIQKTEVIEFIEEAAEKRMYDKMIQSGIPEKQAHKIAYGKAA